MVTNILPESLRLTAEIPQLPQISEVVLRDLGGQGQVVQAAVVLVAAIAILPTFNVLIDRQPRPVCSRLGVYEPIRARIV